MAPGQNLVTSRRPECKGLLGCSKLSLLRNGCQVVSESAASSDFSGSFSTWPSAVTSLRNSASPKALRAKILRSPTLEDFSQVKLFGWFPRGKDIVIWSIGEWSKHVSSTKFWAQLPINRWFLDQAYSAKERRKRWWTSALSGIPVWFLLPETGVMHPGPETLSYNWGGLKPLYSYIVIVVTNIIHHSCWKNQHQLGHQRNLSHDNLFSLPEITAFLWFRPVRPYCVGTPLLRETHWAIALRKSHLQSRCNVSKLEGDLWFGGQNHPAQRISGNVGKTMPCLPPHFSMGKIPPMKMLVWLGDICYCFNMFLTTFSWS